MKKFLLAFSFLVCVPLAASAEAPGVELRRFDAPHHGRTMETAIWFPGEGGEEMRYAENPVFTGVNAKEGAAISAGKYPVILLSHGLGGNQRSSSWLAAGLAERGAIVIAVSHPNSTTGDFDMRKGLEHWTRVQDLETAYQAVSADPVFAPHIDTDRLYATGFSYGGWTALSIGGLKGNHQAYVDICETPGTANSHCRDIAKAGVSLQEIDEAKWNADYRDPRVKAVAAIDPALTFGAPTDGLVEQVLLIGLGEGADRHPATDFSETGSGLAGRLPHAEIMTVSPASHFTAVMVCKPQGAAILREEGEEYPICDDPAGTDRAKAHTQIIEAIAERFGLK